MVAGNVGGKKRIEYTVIGDTVDLVARLQTMSKELCHDLLLNEDAYSQACGKMQFEAQKISDMKVRGRNEPVTICTL